MGSEPFNVKKVPMRPDGEDEARSDNTSIVGADGTIESGTVADGGGLR